MISPGDDLGRPEVVLERLVAQPGDVEVGLVPRHELVVGEGLEPLGLREIDSLRSSAGPEGRVGNGILMTDRIMTRW